MPGRAHVPGTAPVPQASICCGLAPGEFCVYFFREIFSFIVTVLHCFAAIAALAGPGAVPERLITAMSFRATDRAGPILPQMLHSAAGIWQQESAFSSSWQFLAHLYLGSSSSRNFKESPLPNVIVAFPDIAISAHYVTMRLM
jgi:hypothetical protein